MDTLQPKRTRWSQNGHTATKTNTLEPKWTHCNQNKHAGAKMDTLQPKRTRWSQNGRISTFPQLNCPKGCYPELWPFLFACMIHCFCARIPLGLVQWSCKEPTGSGRIFHHANPYAHNDHHWVWCDDPARKTVVWAHMRQSIYAPRIPH